MNRTQHLNADVLPEVPLELAQALPPLGRLTLAELVLPEQTNHYGTLFGPNGLALLGKAAYLVATRFTRQTIVMAAAHRIEFLRPVPVGAVLTLAAQVTRVGRSSLSVQVTACFDVAPGTRADPVLRGEFEMVSVDAHGRPAAVTAPALDPEHVAEQTIAAAHG